MNARAILRIALLLAIAVPAFGQPGPETTAVKQDRFESNRKMAALLTKTLAVSYVKENIFANSIRVSFLADLAKVAPENTLLKWQEMVNAGHQEDAIPEMAAYCNQHITDDPKNVIWAQRVLALAYLRQGEQDNCVSNHTSQSCLYPIGPGGYHQNTRGSRAGIDVLRRILECNPEDDQSIWLLNIAYMTIHEYPDSVPAQWLLRPNLFVSDYALPRFTNVAPQLGVDDEGLAGGCCTEDFDLDGDLDIVTSSWGMKAGMHYFRNNGDGSFTEATQGSGLEFLTGGLNMLHADVDNDGYSDILVLRGAWMREYGRFPNSLLHNNHDGTFTDVTVESGILSFHPTQTAAFADFNNDGHLDLFIGNESGPGIEPCEFYINNGNGTFTNRAHEVGLDVIAFVKGVACGDYDNDGLPDLYLSCHTQTNRLMHNNGVGKDGKWTFTDMAEKAGVGSPIPSFPTFFFDYDNDGWQDLFVCGYGVRSFGSAQPTAVGVVVKDYRREHCDGEPPRLYHNNHNGTFTDVTHAARLEYSMFGMGCNFGDLDNDGFPDIYVGTGLPDLNVVVPNRMFRNFEGKTFQDVTTAGGFGHLQKGHAIAFADLDNDGDQDIYAVMGGAFEGDIAHKALYENPGNGNSWVTLKLEGVKSNRSAIGARIMVDVTTPRGSKCYWCTVNTGGSFGASSLQKGIGLGDATAIKSITVTWPTSKTKQVFKNVALNHFYSIREGDAAPTKLERKAVAFATHGGRVPDEGMDHMHMNHGGSEQPDAHDHHDDEEDHHHHE